jgi:hypothetical protein
MRSELISKAMSQVPNRYLLAKLLAKATRDFHRPGSRIQDTTNDVLERFSRSNPIADAQTVQAPASSSWRSGPGRKIVHASRRSAFLGEVKPSNASLEAIRVLGL